MDTITTAKIGTRGLIAVKVNDKTVGYVRRTVVQVPARNVYYPCTTDRVEWVAQNAEVGYIATFTTRKAAIDKIVNG